MNKPRHRKPVEVGPAKPWLEIVKAWPLPTREQTTSPDTLAIRQARGYTSSGKPTETLFNRLAKRIPPKKAHLGMGRATLRAYTRAEARKEVREFMPKELPRPIWRNVAYAFRRFNPEGLASNQRLERNRLRSKRGVVRSEAA